MKHLIAKHSANEGLPTQTLDIPEIQNDTATKGPKPQKVPTLNLLLQYKSTSLFIDKQSKS